MQCYQYAHIPYLYAHIPYQYAHAPYQYAHVSFISMHITSIPTVPMSYLWRQYDELFRRIKSLCPQVHWHVIHPEILRKARAMSDRFTTNAKRRLEMVNKSNPKV